MHQAAPVVPGEHPVPGQRRVVHHGLQHPVVGQVPRPQAAAGRAHGVDEHLRVRAGVEDRRPLGGQFGERGGQAVVEQQVAGGQVAPVRGVDAGALAPGQRGSARGQRGGVRGRHRNSAAGQLDCRCHHP